MKYPLTFNNEQEHINHVKQNPEFYKNALNDIWEDKVKEMNEKLNLEEEQKRKAIAFKLEEETKLHQEKLKMLEKSIELTYSEKIKEYQTNFIELEQKYKKQSEILEDTKSIQELLKKKTGDVSVYKGKLDEKYIEICLKDVFNENFIIENTNETKKMDIRIKSKIQDFVIGVECKDKKCITKTDIDKFKRDKILNNFNRSIFISNCPIPNILSDDNGVKIIKDELYIYTNDQLFLKAILLHFVSSLDMNENKTSNYDVLFDHIIDNYNLWQKTKKSILELDKSYMKMLKLNENHSSIIKGNLYIQPKSNIKSNKLY